MTKKESIFNYGFSIYHGYGSNLEEAKNLSSILKNEVKNKTLLCLERNQEYQEIVAKIKKFEELLYSVETDENFFEDFSVYEDDPIDYRFSKSKYEDYRHIAENFDNILEEHKRNIIEMNNEFAEIQKTLPERKRFLLPSQKKAKSRLKELEFRIRAEKHSIDNENRINDLMKNVAKKQSINDEAMQNNTKMQKLYARAFEIERAYVQKFAKQVLEKYPFMSGIQYTDKGRKFFSLLNLDFLIKYSDSPERRTHDLELDKILDEQVNVLENEIFERENQGFKP